MLPGAHAPPPARYPLGSHHPRSVKSACTEQRQQRQLLPLLPPAQQPQPQPALTQPAAPAHAAAPSAPANFFGAWWAAQGAASWRYFVANIWELGSNTDVLDDLRPAYANYVNKLLESSRLLPPDEPKPELALIMIVGNARTHHLRLPVHKEIRPLFDKAVLDKIDQINAMLFHSICSAGQNLVSAREVLWADLRPNTPLLFTICKGEQLIRTTASEMHAATGALLVELGVYRDLEGNIGKAMLESIEAMDPEGFSNSLETTKTTRYIVLEQLRGWLGRVYLSKGTQIKAAGGKDQRHTRSFKAFLYNEDGKPLVPNLEELVLSGKVKGVSELKKRLKASTTHSASSTSSDLSASSTSPASPASLATDLYASTSGASLLLFLDEIGTTASAARPVKKRRLQPVLNPLNDLAAPPPKPVR